MTTRRKRSAVPRVGGWRQAHGKSARMGQTHVFEPVADGVRAAPAGAADPIERRTNGTFTTEGARAAVRRRAELEKVPDFAKRELAFVPAGDFEPFDRGRRDLLGGRMGEVHQLTGGVSRAVAATLRGWSWLVALAEFWAVKAATDGDGEAADRAARFFKTASTESAKAADLASWEAEARLNAPSSGPLPWEVEP